MKKKVVMFLLLISIYIILTFICGSKVFAINQTTSTDINSIDSNQYPQIKEMLQNLKNEHPNWNFKILYTDIDWNDAIANEYVGHGSSPRNLSYKSYTGEWRCGVCGDRAYDNGSWYCASEKAIGYMMDARNSANYSDIFQFMELTYGGCNEQTIRTMVSGTFLNNDSYINAIISAAQKYNVNPYYIVARIIQEQGKNGSTLSKGQGYNGQYIGYYNVFNIGANGRGSETIILNGLRKAKSYEWTSIESSIDGGVSIIASSYIAKGQNTLYFQKFDVENSDGNLYWHQYMQNLLAAQSEGSTLRKTFESVSSIDGEYTFIIPLFKNMPSSASPRPGTSGSDVVSTELVRVNVTSTLKLRNEPKGATTVGKVYKDEIVTRLIKATSKVGGTYWDYVMKGDGTKGYAARETYDDENPYKLYLVPIEPEKPDDNNGGNTEINTEKVKMDTVSGEAIAIPNATVKDLKELVGNEIVVKNASGELVTDDNKLATGYTINDTNTVIVLGDINGDGEVDTGDTFLLKLIVLGKKEIPTGCFGRASDINGDGEVDTGDTFLLKKQVLNIGNITL